MGPETHKTYFREMMYSGVFLAFSDLLATRLSSELLHDRVLTVKRPATGTLIDKYAITDELYHLFNIIL